MQPSSLDVALSSVAEFPDIFLFPIYRRKKYPPHIHNNLANASNDPAQIRAWHAKWPGCEWGVSLSKSHMVVVDVDVKPGQGGEHTYAEIGLLFEWPRTRTVRSPSGGLHYWYSGKHVLALGKNGFGQGMDSPNYVLLPGCGLKSGGKYELIDDYPIADAPAWFYEHYLRDKGDKSNEPPTEEPVIDLDQQHNIDWAIHYLKHDAPPAIEGQGGEFTTLKVAAELRDHGIGEVTALDLMNEHYNVPGTCDPQWEGDDLKLKVHNAFVYSHLNAPGERTVEAEFANEVNPFTAEEQEVATIARQDEIKQINTLYKIDDLVRDWVWVTGQKRFVRKRDGKMWDVQQFDSHFNYLTKAASVSKALFKLRDKIDRFDSIVFRPGQAEKLNDLYNSWRQSPVEPKQGDTALWQEHIKYLFPDQTDRDHLLNWLAWVYQNQSLKPNHALLIVGETMGTGKSLVARIFSKLVGEANTKRPKNSSLKGDFNGWALQCKLAIIEELMQIGRREVANELRDIITESTIEVNIKNVPAFETENYMAMFAISNHPDALPLDDGDRRWLVLGTHAKKHPLAQEYYSALFGLLHDPDALGAIAYELQTRNLGTYSALGNAAITNAKRTMISASMSDVDQWLTDMRDQWPLTARVVCVRDIISLMPAHLQRSNRVHNAIGSYLRRNMKGVDVGQRRLPSTRERLRFWVLNGSSILTMSNGDEIGKIYEIDRDAAKSGKHTEDDSAHADFGNAEE
jgi:hypothetical protein